VRYAFIHQHRHQYPVTLLCEVLAVSPSGFYAWHRRQPSQRIVDNQRILIHIRAVFFASKQRFGSRLVHQALRDQGIWISRHRVARLMRQAGLQARRARRYRPTTQSHHRHPIASHVLQRDFNAHRPDEKWAADITYIPTRQGWVYLAVVLDLYSRRVVGWAMSRRLQDRLTLAALRMALQRQRRTGRLLHHSDRGRQYASWAYRQLLARHRIRRSMSRKGNCWDNAPVESFFATLKTDLIYGSIFHTTAQVRQAVFEYIEAFYNHTRPHSTLGYLTPAECERQFEDSITVH
jgi:putative transposase